MTVELYPPQSQTLVASVAERVRLRREGDHLRGRCPFHEDRTPSFVVFPGTATYKCFGCGAYGDLIEWLRRTEGRSYRQARDAAATLVAEGFEHPTSRYPLAEAAPAPLNPAWQARAASLLRYAQDCLWSPEGETALRWLVGPDRLLTESTIRAAGLGYLPRCFEDEPARWGLPDRDHGAPMRLHRAIVIPTSIGGRLWTLKLRPFDPGTGQPDGLKHKYLAVLGSVPGLLGLDDLAPGDVAILLEGEFDRWLCWQAMADDPAFARVTAMTLGAATHRLNRHWLWQLSPARRIISVHDNDGAGRAAAEAYADTPRLTVAFPPPDVKDTTELAQRTGTTQPLGQLSVTYDSRLGARMGALADWLYRLIDPETSP